MKLTGETYNLRGRGFVVIAILSEREELPKIGSSLFYNKNHYKIIGIERSNHIVRFLSLTRTIGLVIKRVDKFYDQTD